MTDPRELEVPQVPDDELDPNVADAEPVEDDGIFGDPNAPQPKNDPIPDEAR